MDAWKHQALNSVRSLRSLSSSSISELGRQFARHREVKSAHQLEPTLLHVMKLLH
jgi:hypothetical protein